MPAKMENTKFLPGGTILYGERLAHGRRWRYGVSATDSAGPLCGCRKNKL
jgi:hypothetical protein